MTPYRATIGVSDDPAVRAADNATSPTERRPRGGDSRTRNAPDDRTHPMQWSFGLAPAEQWTAFQDRCARFDANRKKLLASRLAHHFEREARAAKD